MKLTFYGGAKSVTGANYLLEANGVKILVDCGLSQGSRYSEELNYHAFGYDPSQVDFLLITHSHADHIGRIPKLYRDGFRGQIIATEPTAEITRVALPDSMDKVGQEAKDNGHPPLYTQKDIDDTMSLVRPTKYKEVLPLGKGVKAIFHDASHILGSAIIEIIVEEEGETKRIGFTGDLGNPPTVLLNPIDYVEDLDYLVIESAYGNRIHEDRTERRQKLTDVVQETVKRGGVLMIPSFAIERSQELLLEFDRMFEHGELPKVPIFVDSPLAIKITEVYGRYSSYFNPEAIKLLENNQGLFKFPWLTFTPTTQESKNINNAPSPKIIIAGSGMSQGGRILHHESRYLPDPNSTILFVGYQVNGSLGRRILDGATAVTIFGQHVPVRCRVEAIGAYSAHADQNGLLKCVEMANKGRGLKEVFIVQGEEDSANDLGAKIKEKLGLKALVPDPNYSADL